MADPTKDAPAENAEEQGIITDPVEMAIIEIAAIAERYDNYGEFRANLKNLSDGLYEIAKGKTAESTKAKPKG